MTVIHSCYKIVTERLVTVTFLYPKQPGVFIRWNKLNSGMTTPTSRAMTNTRNDLYLSTEDKTVQRAF